MLLGNNTHHHNQEGVKEKKAAMMCYNEDKGRGETLQGGMNHAEEWETSLTETSLARGPASTCGRVSIVSSEKW